MHENCGIVAPRAVASHLNGLRETCGIMAPEAVEGGSKRCSLCLQEQEHSGEQSRMRQLASSELLVQMPFLQKLLQRLLDCKPTGAASHDAVVQVPTNMFFAAKYQW